MTTGNLAWLIIGAILLQLAIAMVPGWVRRRRRHQEPGTGQHVPRITPVSPAPEAGAGAPVPTWEGFREFRVQRRVIEDGGGSVCSFYLVPADGRPLPAFKPGQYLTFRLEVEDPQGGGSRTRTLTRCYSLSDRPRPDHYRISVKRVPAPPGRPELPAGRSSSHLHDRVQEGARLMVKSPAGHFHLQEDGLPVVLIGGGIGITPMLSIIETVLAGGGPRELWLFYGVRNGTEHVMKAHLLALAREHANLHLHVCYSEPREEDVEGVDYQHRGRVDLALLRASLKLTRYGFYVCGPKPMMESLVSGLEEWGVDSGDIHYESFGPASLIRHAPPPPREAPAAVPVTVTFARSGRSMPWDPAAGSLLAFAEAGGIEVESGCRAGSCGSCQTAIRAGEVEYDQAPDAELEPGHCLLCISTPKGDLTLDA